MFLHIVCFTDSGGSYLIVPYCVTLLPQLLSEITELLPQLLSKSGKLLPRLLSVFSSYLFDNQNKKTIFADGNKMMY